MKVTRVTFKMEHEDGTHSQVVRLMPEKIADWFSCEVISWDHNWRGTFAEVEEYNKAEQKAKFEKPKPTEE